MKLNKIVIGQTAVAVISDEKPVITGVQSALDLIMQVKQNCETNKIAIAKPAVAEDFFILSTGLAGEILQKFITYDAKLAVYGDFTRYTSKPLRDFIYESNQGRDCFFAPSQEEAIQKLIGTVM